MEEIIIKPIGVIHSPYKERAPRQGRYSDEICEIEIFPEYQDGLKDIELCSNLIILYSSEIDAILDAKIEWMKR